MKSWKLDVIKHGRWYLSLSAILLLASLVAMVISWQTFGAPLRPAIDFTGGTRISLELQCKTPNNCGEPIDIAKVRQALAAKGYREAVLQLAGSDRRGLALQTGDLDVEARENLQKDLAAVLAPYGTLDPRKSQIEKIGPIVGAELLRKGLLALLVGFVGIGAYLYVRFQADYAFFAIVALFHDAFITAGVFAFLGLTLGVQVDSLFVVALLTIVGFSVNDTVVIYDRIRENLKLAGVDADIKELVNRSVNQTLARSINTSVTALLSLVSIFLFGGATLKYFSLALIVGFLLGAYSSIFNASILLAWWRSRKHPPASQSVTG